MAARLEIQSVTKSFLTPSGKPLHALGPIDLIIGDEICVVLGPSGCGKSTLLRQIAGLDRPTSGAILLDGRPVLGPGRDRGMVFQKYTSFPWLTVADNVAYGLKLLRVGKNQIEEQKAKWVAAVGLSEFAGSYPDTLSGGMQQRVALARTLAVTPKVVLMDEPFGALDAQTRGEMQELIKTIRKDTAATIVFVTHDVREALYLGDRLVVMTPGPGQISQPVWDLNATLGRGVRERESREFVQAEELILQQLRGAPVPVGESSPLRPAESPQSDAWPWPEPTGETES